MYAHGGMRRSCHEHFHMAHACVQARKQAPTQARSYTHHGQTNIMIRHAASHHAQMPYRLPHPAAPCQPLRRAILQPHHATPCLKHTTPRHALTAPRHTMPQTHHATPCLNRTTPHHALTARRRTMPQLSRTAPCRTHHTMHTQRDAQVTYH